MINLLEEKPINIAGVMFVANPENIDEVAEKLSHYPGAEIHAKSENGNMVVTVEEQVEVPRAKNQLIDTITQMSKIAGVISSSLIFHHNDAGLPQHQELSK